MSHIGEIRKIVESQKEWDGRLNPNAVARRRRLYQELSPSDQCLFTEMVDIVRSGRKALLSAHLPWLEDVLEMESRVGATISPTRLLDLASEGGDDDMDERRRFEALHLFDFARLLMWLEQQPGESRRAVGEDIADLGDEFARHLFMAGTRRINVTTVHDPDKHFRVSEVLFDQEPSAPLSEHARDHVMHCRLLSGDVPVLFREDSKELFNAGLKVYQQFADKRRRADGWKVNDRRRFRMVIRDVRDANRLLEGLRALSHKIGATFDYDPKRDNNMTSDGTAKMDRANRHSSPKFKAAKVVLVWRGRSFEVLLMTARDYYSSQYAMDEENHDRYWLRKLLEEHLPRLWPTRFYDEHWEGEDISILLLAHAEVKHNGRVRRPHRRRRT